MNKRSRKWVENIMNKNRPMAERSKSFMGLCKNDRCYMKRRTASAYCEGCSLAHNKRDTAIK